MPCTPTFTCRKPRTTRDGITLLGEAARSPREVNAAGEMLALFLHLLCKTLRRPKVHRHYRAPEFAAIAARQHELAAPATEGSLRRGLSAPEATTTATFFLTVFLGQAAPSLTMG